MSPCHSITAIKVFAGRGFAPEATRWYPFYGTGKGMKALLRQAALIARTNPRLAYDLLAGSPDARDIYEGLSGRECNRWVLLKEEPASVRGLPADVRADVYEMAQKRLQPSRLKPSPEARDILNGLSRLERLQWANLRKVPASIQHLPASLRAEIDALVQRYGLKHHFE